MQQMSKLMIVLIGVILSGCAMQTSVGVESQPTGAKIFHAGVNDPEVVPLPSNLGNGQQAVTDSNMVLNWRRMQHDAKVLVEWPDGTRSQAAVIPMHSNACTVMFKKGEVPVITEYKQP